jgi:hypothetical protein
LDEAKRNCWLCHFYKKNEKNSFVPLFFEVSPCLNDNLIIGYSLEERDVVILQLTDIKSVTVEKNKKEITEDILKLAQKIYDEYYDIECEDYYS